MNLTARSGDEIVRYVAWHNKELGYPPSLRAIGKAFGINSTSTVQEVIKNLERQGKITRDGNRKMIRVVSGHNPEICQHDWRVKTTEANENGEIFVVCILCWRETAVEYKPDPAKPETWFRFMEQQ